MTKAPAALDEFAEVQISQTHEFLPLQACIIGNPHDNVLPPYNEATRSYTDHLPEPLREAIVKMGSRPATLQELKPDWYEKIVVALDELEAIYRRHGVKVFRAKDASSEIKNYFGYTQAGYWSFGVADAWKVIGNAMVEIGSTDNIRAINPQVFEYRDLIWKAFENSPDAVWVSMPPAAPSDPAVSAGRGPFVVGADIKILDEGNILVACGVESSSAVGDRSQPRSAMNEDGVSVLRAYARSLGYEVHQTYYDSAVSFHHDTIFGMVAPGIVAFPEDAHFVMPDYVRDNFEILPMPMDECINDLAGNMMNINDSTVVINARAERTIKLVEATGVTVEAIDYDIGSILGTGPWCSTCAIQRG
jgi:hypothetical protein